MNRSIITKTAAMIIAATLSFGLASCGSSDSSSSKVSVSQKSEDISSSAPADPGADTSADGESQAPSGEVKGETKNWGIYTVLVPEGWTLRTGDVFNDNDETVCSVKKSDLSYFNLNCETEDTQKKKYEYNKKTYTLNQKDLPASTIAGIEWNGFEYGNEIGKGFELYGKSNGRFIRVSGVGIAFDSPEAKAVLGSLAVTAAEDESTPDESTADVSNPDESTADVSTPDESTADVSTPDESTADGGAPAVSPDAALADKGKVVLNGAAFGMGDKFADVKDKLGDQAKPPKSSKPCVPGAQDVEFNYYPGLTVQVNYEGTVIAATISGDDAPGRDASLAAGVKIGSSRDDVKALMGEPGSEDEFGLQYMEGDLRISIYDREDEGVFCISIEDSSLPF